MRPALPPRSRPTPLTPSQDWTLSRTTRSSSKRGAVDFLIKPFQLIQLVQVLRTSLSERRLQRENAELRARLNDRFRFGNMIGGSQVMKRLFNTLELVSPMNS